MVNSLDDSKIIELFYEHSEQAIIELSNKYGTVCTRVTKGVASAAPFKYVGLSMICYIVLQKIIESSFR